MERQKLFNRSYWIWIVSGVVELLAMFLFLKTENSFTRIVFAVLGVTFITGLFFTPYQYQFDINGISICYLFGRKQRYLWKKIDLIVGKVVYEEANNYWYEYQIKGTPENKLHFYMKDSIRKTKKLKCILEEYGKGKIVDFTEYHNYKTDKTQDFSQGISFLEKGMQENIKKYVDRYHLPLYNMGLCLKISFTYLSEQGAFAESVQRPGGNSCYTAVLEIAKQNETEPNKVVRSDIRLLHVKENKQKVSLDTTIMYMLGLFDQTVQRIICCGID